ncbi:hypothetical protein [Sphingomicrobium arenosum]|uniref:hypothetical protein n=1 Tax=Sphingomicrobium arenosum TaxID=2233861 RepID=UPI002240D99A|nr:hypothetical protein [Sphingomicrobium arenosum]
MTEFRVEKRRSPSSLGGFAGSVGGTRMAKAMSAKGALTKAFAVIIVIVALYMLWQSGSALGIV